MKKHSILLTLAILVIACKNDSKTETSSAPPASGPATQLTPQPALDLAKAGIVLEKAKVTIEEIKTLRKQIEGLPENVKTTNADNIENLRSTLEGLEEKEAMFIKELDEALSTTNTPAPNDGASTDKTAVIQDAVQSLEGYAEDLKWVKGQVEILSKKQ
jgi:hypothetical protein